MKFINCLFVFQVKSEQYWPNDNDEQEYGEIHITHINTVTKPSWTIRKFELEKVSQLQLYSLWFTTALVYKDNSQSQLNLGC